MAAVDGAGEDLQVRKARARDVDDVQGLVRFVHRDHQHFRPLGARGAQQVFARGVAVIHLAAEAPHQFHLARAVVENREAVALRVEQAADDLTKAAIARDDRFGAVVELAGRGHRGCILAAAAEAFLVEQEQQRREQHG